jgi:hypothetical protein
LVIPVTVRNNIKNQGSQSQYPSQSNKKSIPSLSTQGQYPSRRSKQDKETSLVLVFHQGDILYKRRSNRFTTIVLQELRIQEQGLDRKLQGLCWQDWGFPHLAFIIYYQTTIRKTLEKQYNYPYLISLTFGSNKSCWHLKPRPYALLRVTMDIMQIYLDAHKSQCKSYLQDLR